MKGQRMKLHVEVQDWRHKRELAAGEAEFDGRHPAGASREHARDFSELVSIVISKQRIAAAQSKGAGAWMEIAALSPYVSVPDPGKQLRMWKMMDSQWHFPSGRDPGPGDLGILGDLLHSMTDERAQEEGSLQACEALVHHYVHLATRTKGFEGIGKIPPGSAHHSLLLHGCGTLLQWMAGLGKDVVNLAPSSFQVVWQLLPTSVLLTAAARVAEGLLVPGSPLPDDTLENWCAYIALDFAASWAATDEAISRPSAPPSGPEPSWRTAERRPGDESRSKHHDMRALGDLLNRLCSSIPATASGHDNTAAPTDTNEGINSSSSSSAAAAMEAVLRAVRIDVGSAESSTSSKGDGGTSAVDRSVRLLARAPPAGKSPGDTPPYGGDSSNGTDSGNGTSEAYDLAALAQALFDLPDHAIASALRAGGLVSSGPGLPAAWSSGAAAAPLMAALCAALSARLHLRRAADAVMRSAAVALLRLPAAEARCPLDDHARLALLHPTSQGDCFFCPGVLSEHQQYFLPWSPTAKVSGAANSSSNTNSGGAGEWADAWMEDGELQQEPWQETAVARAAANCAAACASLAAGAAAAQPLKGQPWRRKGGASGSSGSSGSGGVEGPAAAASQRAQPPASDSTYWRSRLLQRFRSARPEGMAVLQQQVIKGGLAANNETRELWIMLSRALLHEVVALPPLIAGLLFNPSDAEILAPARDVPHGRRESIRERDLLRASTLKTAGLAASETFSKLACQGFIHEDRNMYTNTTSPGPLSFPTRQLEAVLKLSALATQSPEVCENRVSISKVDSIIPLLPGPCLSGRMAWAALLDEAARGLPSPAPSPAASPASPGLAAKWLPQAAVDAVLEASDAVGGNAATAAETNSAEGRGDGASGSGVAVSHVDVQKLMTEAEQQQDKQQQQGEGGQGQGPPKQRPPKQQAGERWRLRAAPEDARLTQNMAQATQQAVAGLWAMEIEAAGGDPSDPEDRLRACTLAAARAARDGLVTALTYRMHPLRAAMQDGVDRMVTWQQFAEARTNSSTGDVGAFKAAKELCAGCLSQIPGGTSTGSAGGGAAETCPDCRIALFCSPTCLASGQFSGYHRRVCSRFIAAARDAPELAVGLDIDQAFDVNWEDDEMRANLMEMADESLQRLEAPVPWSAVLSAGDAAGAAAGDDEAAAARQEVALAALLQECSGAEGAIDSLDAIDEDAIYEHLQRIGGIDTSSDSDDLLNAAGLRRDRYMEIVAARRLGAAMRGADADAWDLIDVD